MNPKQIRTEGQKNLDNLAKKLRSQLEATQELGDNLKDPCLVLGILFL